MESLEMECMKRSEGIVGPAVKRKSLKAALDTGRFFFKPLP